MYLPIFTRQLFLLDNWEKIYDLILAVSGQFAVLYFIFLISFGAFFVMNLVLAVVAHNYSLSSIANKKRNSLSSVNFGIIVVFYFLKTRVTLFCFSKTCDSFCFFKIKIIMHGNHFYC
jgi:hypothetical protein